jgi:MoxR-like ATPase
MARALAWLRGQDFVAPTLIQELAPDVLRHRIGLTYEAEAENITTDTIVAQVIAQTPMPTTGAHTPVNPKHLENPKS